jgi:hypothetical protein
MLAVVALVGLAGSGLLGARAKRGMTWIEVAPRDEISAELAGRVRRGAVEGFDVLLACGERTVRSNASTERSSGGNSPQVVSWEFAWPEGAPLEPPLRLRFPSAMLRAPIDGYSGPIDIEPLELLLPAMAGEGDPAAAPPIR